MKIKLVAIVVVVFLGVAVALYCIGAKASVASENAGYIAAARDNAERDIPYVAITNFKKSFDIVAPDEELYIEYLAQTEKLGEDFYYEAVAEYLTRFPMSTNAYELNIKRLYEEESYKKAVDLALEAHEKGIANEVIEDYYTKSFYQYKYVKTDLQYASMFLGDIALVKKGDLYGYLYYDGTYLVSPTFKDASFMLGPTSAVYDGKEWYMINQLGYKIARTDKRVSELSFLSNGLVLAKMNKKYTYLTTSLTVPENFIYDDATNFKNNVAAVKKDSKWALVGSDGKNITDYIFDDVIRDEFNTCINNGIIFAKKDGGYYMFDSDGKKVSDEKFEDARMFVSAQFAAVKKDGKWGFADETGKIVIEPQYEDAGSFCCGLAPVCVNEHWNYINNAGEVRIKGEFNDAKAFASNGIAPVLEGESWNYIRLITYFD